MLKGPQSLVRMKAMDPGATPMISVPTRVLEEFRTNSPSPPAALSVPLEAAVDSPKATAQTRTPSPDIPNKLSDSALPTDTSSMSTDTSKYVNGITENGSDNDNTDTNMVSDTCDKSDTLPAVAATEIANNTVNTKLPVDAPVNSDLTEKKLNGIIGPSLKRPIEEQGETLQDLKKVRVFARDKTKGFAPSTPEFNKVDENSKNLKPNEDSKNGDQDEIMCLSSSDSLSATKTEERTSSESKKTDLKSSIFDNHLPKFEENKLENKISVSDSTKENSSPFSSDLEVLTPSNDEKSKVSRRLKKLPRKELEKVILRLFSEKTLYECELGRQKQLCEKLETTLEANRKKTAQFHKEIEDLKKVTSRLSAEQQSRKGQFVAPIRIKRSVGIQAAPHIINKGLHHAQNSAIKTISPRAGSIKTGPGRMQQSSNIAFQAKVNHNLSPHKVGSGPPVAGGFPSTLQHQGGRPLPSAGGMLTGITSMANTGLLPVGPPPASIGTIRPTSGQMMLMTPSVPGMMQAIPRPALGGPLSLPVTSNKVMIPLVQGKVVRSSVVPISNIIPSGNLSQRPLLLQNQAVTATTSAISTPLVSKGTGFVDLTADEGRGTVGRTQTVMSTPGALVKVPVTGAQLVAIPQAGGMVLVPGASPGTALVVSQMSGQTVNSVGNPVVVQARSGPVSSSRVMGTSFRPISAPVTSPSVGVSQHRHPAPLPRTPVQQVAGITKKLPPQPTLKLSHKENSIVLSWTMSKTEDHESIASYQLYAYQEGNSPPSAALWKKVGSVKALELPMACTLTQFMPGHVYHFAVRAVDIKSRLGPFSEPRSIRLEKK